MAVEEAGWSAMNYIQYFLIFSFLSIAVFGQNAPAPVIIDESKLNSAAITDGNVTSAIPIPLKRSSEQETIARAGENLRSSDVGKRVGAAKLLGKYRSSLSSHLLIGALDDSSPLVRRAVMVSLAEHASYGFVVYERPLVEKIYSKLADPDVEVRREVSTMIPRLISGMMRSGMEIVEINGRKVYRSIPAAMRPDLFQITQNAFLDQDAIVRQNILKYYSYLRVPLTVSTLEKLLMDQDIGVLLAALSRVTSNASQPNIVSQVKKLSVHKEKGIRLKVVSVARDANRYHPGYRSILREMTGDLDHEVLSMAAVELARFGERVPTEVVEKIKLFLLGVDGMTTQVTTILYAISALGVDGVGVYRALTEHSSSQMRSISWQRYISLSEGWNDSSLWMPGLTDRDKKVRNAVLNSVRGRTDSLNEGELSKLVESQYADVRIFAAQCLLNANMEAVGSLGFDLLIDEDTIVRSTTIRALSTRKVPGWIKVMTRSLLDSDYVIQRAAMDGLLEDREKGIPALIQYIIKNPQTRISNLASNELRKIGVQL